MGKFFFDRIAGSRRKKRNMGLHQIKKLPNKRISSKNKNLQNEKEH
jgi:hypothetical protein